MSQSTSASELMWLLVLWYALGESLVVVKVLERGRWHPLSLVSFQVAWTREPQRGRKREGDRVSWAVLFETATYTSTRTIERRRTEV